MFITPKLPHRAGRTRPSVYYTKVTALKWTNGHLCLLDQSYCTELDERALQVITPKLPHSNGLTGTYVYYTKVTTLKWNKGELCLLITPKLPHRAGLTRPSVYDTKVTALKWTNDHLCLLHQSYHTRIDGCALEFITANVHFH